METGPRRESMEALAVQPDLLALYGETQASAFGMSGSFADLAGMCPVDLSDPKVSLEAKNEFVIKIANESGVAIAPEHETIFAHGVEKHGLERKFSIAAPPRTSQPDRKPIPEKTSIMSATTPKVDVSPIPKNDPIPTEHRVRELTRTLDMPNIATLQPIVEPIPTAKKPAERVHVVPPVVQAKLIAKSINFTAARIHMPEPDSPPAPDVAPLAAVKPPVTPESKPTPSPKPVLEIHTLTQVVPASTITAEVLQPPEPLTFPVTIPALEMIEENTEAEPIELENNITVIDEPLILPAPIDTIPDILPEFSEPRIETDLFESPDIIIDAAAEAAPQPPLKFEEIVQTLETSFDLEPLPPIFTTVTEHLLELSPDVISETAPILQTFVESAQIITVMEQDNFDQTSIEAAKAVLKEEIIHYFEAIGLQYTPEDIEEFMHALLRPHVEPENPVAQTIAADLEREGTREAKWRFVKLTSDDISAVGYEAGRLLGKLAMACMSPTGILL